MTNATNCCNQPDTCRARRCEFKIAWWRTQWCEAVKNMPCRNVTVTDQQWLEVGTPVSVPDFITGQAQGRYSLHDGLVFELREVKHPISRGCGANLARLLGCMFTQQSTGKRLPNHHLVMQGCSGWRTPRNKGRQALLMRYAGVDGYEYAKTDLALAYPDVLARCPDRYWYGSYSSYIPAG